MMKKSRYMRGMLAAVLLVYSNLLVFSGDEISDNLEKSIWSEMKSMFLIMAMLAELEGNPIEGMGEDWNLLKEAEKHFKIGQYGQAYKKVRTVKAAVNPAFLKAIESGIVSESKLKEVLDHQCETAFLRLEYLKTKHDAYEIITKGIPLLHEGTKLFLQKKYPESYRKNEEIIMMMEPYIIREFDKP